ncbi:hypothetical protein HMPREF1861_02358 [Corynebacterium kroppenstedtii]|nr:hypothetical protein HMPREF1861_02358 [Corynebacterium kroppenstedtii]
MATTFAATGGVTFRRNTFTLLTLVIIDHKLVSTLVRVNRK